MAPEVRTPFVGRVITGRGNRITRCLDSISVSGALEHTSFACGGSRSRWELPALSAHILGYYDGYTPRRHMVTPVTLTGYNSIRRVHGAVMGNNPVSYT
jgi:hypothetical protein